MAKGRMISKAISLDEKVNALSDDTCRLLFTWLITHLDCEGRMHGDPQTVKSIVFPRRNSSAKKIEKYLKELQNCALISRYSVNGNEYLWMKNFQKHQVGLNKDREARSQIPPFLTDPTQELVRSKDMSDSRLGLIEVKDQVKDKTKTKSSISLENTLEIYQSNIGAYTEDIEEQVKDACEAFTSEWVTDAIKEAVRHKKRSWAYVSGVLKNWRRNGRDTLPQKDPDKYIKGKFGHMVQR